jgi:hypothetical protein
MDTAQKPNGVAAAAILAAGVGVFTIGLLTTLNEVSSGLSSRLIWVRSVGPLSGKTGVGVIVWLIAWVVLHSMYKGREVEFGRIMRWAWILILLGFLLTFPPAFEIIAETIHGK